MFDDSWTREDHLDQCAEEESAAHQQVEAEWLDWLEGSTNEPH